MLMGFNMFAFDLFGSVRHLENDDDDRPEPKRHASVEASDQAAETAANRERPSDIFFWGLYPSL